MDLPYAIGLVLEKFVLAITLSIVKSPIKRHRASFS